MAESTPLALRRLEADWRDRRRERMEASLRRRAKDVGVPGSLRSPATSGDTMPPKMSLARISADLVDSSLPRNRSHTKRGDGSAEERKTKTPETISPRPIEPQQVVPNTKTSPARHVAKYLEFPGHEMAATPATKLEALSSGALPPGIYTLDRGRLVIRPTIPVGSTSTCLAMEIVARKVRYDISPDGCLCTITELSPRAHTNGPSVLRLTDSSGWTRRELGIWSYVSAIIHQAKKKTDQGRIHVTCSSPPEIVFYSNDTPAPPALAPIVTCSKIVVDQLSDTCTISLSRKPRSSGKNAGKDVGMAHTSHVLTKRVLRGMEVPKLLKALKEQPANGDWAWSTVEVATMRDFLDTLPVWKRYLES